MPMLALHHVSLVVTDLERSVPFYRDVFELTEIERPPFPFRGAWFACGALQVHLIVNKEGTFRQSPGFKRNDVHFAFRTDDFEAHVARLAALGFREDAEQDDPRFMYVNRRATAGFPQLFVCDPDRNIIQINGAP